jgi:hypothetical protein
LTIEIKGHITKKDGLWRINAQLYFNDELDEKMVEFIIDSGSEITLLSPNVAKRIGFSFDTLPVIDEIPIGGPGECTARYLPNVSIIFKGIDWITQCRMYVPNPKCWKKRGWSLVGQDVLRQFNLTSDNKNKRIVLKPISSITAPMMFRKQ